MDTRRRLSKCHSNLSPFYTDYTNHGYGDKGKPAEYHSDPHTHTYEYGPGYGPKGKETRVNND